ncbi:MAG: lipid A deacylase LpxR family protein [Acetobacteraceae bacterium]
MRVSLRLLPLIAGLIGSASAHAEPTPDPGTIITVQVENDSLTGTDRYYTSGVRLGVTLPTGQLPDFTRDFGHWLWGDGQQRLAFDLTQSIFTPRDTQRVPPDPRDRPYAAILLSTASLVQDTDTTRNILSIGVGAIGRPALGEWAQNTVHRIVSAKQALGWDYQLPGQPVVQITADRIWRLPIASGPLEVDVLPQLTAGVGTWRIYAQAGVQFRIGQGLDADFGGSRNRPGLSGGDAFHATRPLAWYVFAGVDGQAVAWDETLDGEPFASTRHVSRRPLVGEFQVGVAVMVADRMRATFTQIWQTHEFYGQRRQLFGFSSAALSVKF